MQRKVLEQCLEVRESVLVSATLRGRAHESAFLGMQIVDQSLVTLKVEGSDVQNSAVLGNHCHMQRVGKALERVQRGQHTLAATRGNEQYMM